MEIFGASSVELGVIRSIVALLGSRDSQVGQTCMSCVGMCVRV